MIVYQNTGLGLDLSNRVVPVVSFYIDSIGKLAFLGFSAQEERDFGGGHWAVGSVWVNGGDAEQLDDIFAVTDLLIPHRHRELTPFGTPAVRHVPVAPGDIVTVLLYDEGTGAPDWPVGLWTLGVQV